MNNANINVVTAIQEFPAGTTSGGIKISISDGTNEQHQVITAAPYDATFTSLAPGAYTVVAQAEDASGALLGSPVTDTFIISQPVNIDVPVSVTVTVQ